MKRLSLSLALLSLLTGCFVVPENATPFVGAELGVSDKYVHRGMPQNRNGVAQGSAEIGLPTKWGEEDSINLRAWGNMDLRDSTGKAWFPGDHAGRLSEIDFIGSYTHVIGDFDITGGLHNYNLPFGSEFAFGARSSTNAAFVRVGTEVLQVRPQLEVFWDFDEADGVYVRLGVTEDFALTDELTLILNGFIGYTSDDQAFWDYGIATDGFADIQGTATLAYTLDSHTTIGGHLDASTIVDDGLSDWFDIIGIPTSNVWGGVFVQWTY